MKAELHIILSYLKKNCDTVTTDKIRKTKPMNVHWEYAFMATIFSRINNDSQGAMLAKVTDNIS